MTCLPVVWVSSPAGNANAGRGFIPRGRINIFEAPIFIPKCRPLHLRSNRLIGENGIHMFNGVVKTYSRGYELIPIDVGGETQPAHFDCEDGCHRALQHCLHGNRQRRSSRGFTRCRSNRRRSDHEEGWAALCRRRSRGRQALRCG